MHALVSAFDSPLPSVGKCITMSRSPSRVFSLSSYESFGNQRALADLASPVDRHHWGVLQGLLDLADHMARIERRQVRRLVRCHFVAKVAAISSPPSSLFRRQAARSDAIASYLPL